MARRGFRFIQPLAEASGIQYGTLRPAITSRKRRYPLHLTDIYRLAEVLRESGEKTEDVVTDIVAAGTPDEPPEKKTKDTQGPGRRKDSEDRKTGPKRATERAA
jgi:hypothetical protein